MINGGNHNTVDPVNICLHSQRTAAVHASTVVDLQTQQHTWHRLPLIARLQNNHTVGGFPSQLNLNGWLHELRFEEDKELRSYLMEGVKNGFRILDRNADIKEYECYNYKSALTGEAHVFLDSVIRKEIQEGKYIKTDVKPRNVHAIGAVPKSNNTYRPITDCKRPLQKSVNNYMTTTHQPFSFSTVDQVADMILPGFYMSSVDISAAYRSVPIHPEDWDHQGIEWQCDGHSQYYKDTRLCFGVRCAPYIFTKISSFIVRCMNRRGYMNVVGYIDDFWIGEPTYELCAQGQQALISLLGDLGFNVNWNKCVSPNTSIRYLGIIFNSIDMSLSLPEDKMTKLRKEIQFFDGKNRATKSQLQRLCGTLAHASKVIYGGRIFSRRVIDLLRGLPDKNVRIRLSKDFRMDMEWWAEYARQYNGHATMINHHYTEDIHLYTDASKNGYGLVLQKDWMAGYFDSKLQPQGIDVLDREHGHWHNVEINDCFNINVAELLPVWLAVKRHSKEWCNRRVICHTDNTQVKWSINRGRSINENSMKLLRLIFWESVSCNFYIVASHIEGAVNFLPDLLSRLYKSNDLAKLQGCGLCCVDY